MRYRGKIFVKFIGKSERTREIVAIADDMETAKKKMSIEMCGDYQNNPRVEYFYLLPPETDSTEKPKLEFIENQLTTICDRSRTVSDQENARNNLYHAFRAYAPDFDDDTLSDILSECRYGDPWPERLAEMAKILFDELDAEWCCYYDPTLPLEEQYQDTLQ